MELATLDMDRTKAREKFLEYRRSVRARHNKEDEQIMRGYRALSQGHQVIDIVATIRKGGTTTVPPHWRGGKPCWVPRLALMRADQAWCMVRTYDSGRVEYHHTGRPQTNERRNYFRLPLGTFTPPPDTTDCWWTAKAMVPPVPPAFRPADKIGNYHLLWEAEWKREPPKDPALLKHIGGDLYAVLAVWDLTELERCVLGGRFR